MTTPAEDQTTADAAAENVRLRAALLDENRKLREALEANATDALTSQGLTDEDVRRLESPDEFVLSNDEISARLAELESAAGRVQARQTLAGAGAAADTGNEQLPEFVRNEDGSYTRTADGVRGSFGPDGFTAA